MERVITKRVSRFSYIGVLFMNFVAWILFVFQTTDDLYAINLSVDFLFLTIIELLLLLHSRKRTLDIFDPIYFVSAIYLCMFYVAPIYDIITTEYHWYGYSLFPYGVKASIYAFLGYLAMYIAYTFGLSRRKPSVYSYNDSESILSVSKNRKQFKLIVIYCMYAVSFAANVYYLINTGFGSLRYILTLGLSGAENVSGGAGDIGFISMFSYMLPTIVLLAFEYNDNKTINTLLFVPMLMLQIARGYRFFIIHIIVMFVVYFYMKKGERPKTRKLVFFTVAIMLIVLIMTMFRQAIRNGTGMDLSAINGSAFMRTFEEAFWDNLRIYQNFYGMVKVIPSEYGFVGLRQILIGTVIMTIPRAIWPGKISSYGGESLRTLIGENLAAGQAYPTLGEYYYAFGIIGIILFMAIFGFWLRKLAYKYMYSDNILNIIFYAVMLGCCLQLIIRGYFPSNFWYVLFSVLPVWVIKKL